MLLTGATGVVGRNLRPVLCRHGYRVLTRAAAGAVRVERRTKSAELPKVDACSVSIYDARLDTPCTELELYEARWVSGSRPFGPRLIAAPTHRGPGASRR